MDSSGGSPKQRVLDCVNQAEGLVAPSDVAEELDMDPRIVAVYLKRLMDEGKVVKPFRGRYGPAKDLTELAMDALRTAITLCEEGMNSDVDDERKRMWANSLNRLISGLVNLQRIRENPEEEESLAVYLSGLRRRTPRRMRRYVFPSARGRRTGRWSKRRTR